MAISGTVRHDLSGLEARLRLHPKELLAADLRARNLTATSSRTEAVRRLRSELPGIKAGTIRRQLKITRATRTNLRAMLEFSEKRLRLFGNTPLRRIVSRYGTGARLSKMPFRVELADGTAVTSDQLRRLFIQRSRGGLVNVWVREGSKSKPFQAVVVGSLSRAFRERGIGPAVLAFGRQRMRVVFAHEMKFRIAKRHGLVLPGST